MKLTPYLTAYIALTLLGLWAAADRFAPYHGAPAACRIGYVIDGDTVALRCGAEKRVGRLVGFDAPEVRSPKCKSEAAWGARATERLRGLLSGPDVVIYPKGTEKYGRDLVLITVAGRDVAAVMIGEGLGVDYHGEARRNWCG
ncbi:MAG: thermonuclease family protein [Cypionkella sp.]|uniref:thermonuclease family protein n=1 Tax=Cypionkella sp. TaxID=2811411 RepID=UPI002AB931D3|nr:thermonuclease family protein [Cypionkella sp.]MDZ4309211.1 thermonuclease family protein [Cypionkella sp.]